MPCSESRAYNLSATLRLSNNTKERAAYLSRNAELSRAKLIVQRPTRPLILSLDTATEQRSVALSRGEQQLALHAGGTARGHSTHLLEEIDEILRREGVSLKEIELFAVACGPGSFTGLRAGLATVKAFAATLERPVVGVPTLHAVALAAGPAPKILAALPAGRGEVFAQLLEVTDAGLVLELGEPAHLALLRLAERVAGLGGTVKWAGGGAWAQAEALREFAKSVGVRWREAEVEESRHKEESDIVWTLAPQVESYAGEIAHLARQQFQAGMNVSVEQVRALYVRLSDAESKEQCRASSVCGEPAPPSS